MADRVYDHLALQYSRKTLFKDVDNVPVGVDFRTYIEGAIKRSSIVLAIIGPNWLSVKGASGQRRIDDAEDSIRVELSSALRLERKIIPLLVGSTQMPPEDALPPELKRLAYINALSVRPDPDFRDDIAKLLRSLGMAGRRWYSGWIARTGVVAVALGIVVAITWNVESWMRPPPVPLTIGPVRPMQQSEPPPPPTTPQSGCVDVPFTDNTKIPPVMTTKRICS